MSVVGHCIASSSWSCLNEVGGRDAGTDLYTVHEAARILRVDATTIYRSIRAGSFPAIRIRSRYVIPSAALREVAAKAVSSGTCVDLTDFAAHDVVSRRYR